MNIIEKAVAKLEAELDAVNAQETTTEQNSPEKRVEGVTTAVVDAEGSRAVESTDGSSVSVGPTSAIPSSTTIKPGAKREFNPDRSSNDYSPVKAAPSNQDLESVSDVVEIEVASLSAAGFLTPDRSESMLAEQMRIIKRPLLARATPDSDSYVKDGNLIIVTSSLPGEGKTFCSINLSMSIAMEMDRTILLVDADPAKSDVSRVLGLTQKKGLTNFLSGEENDLSKLLVRTKEPQMSVLPSGPRHPRMTELISSQEMRRLITELSTRYPDRIVVFDSPPLLATSGTGVLATLMGQVVMVVEAVRTPQSAIREALRQLGSARNVGVLFNKERSSASGGYGYGYAYGYGAENANET
jgi:protein-tyrosine kinase